MAYTTPLSALIFLLLFFSSSMRCHGHLRAGFYADTCPDAEAIVASIVQDAVKSEPTLAAALLRLHFHDCFVDGCDGSILIDKSDGTEEKKAFENQGLRGFDVVEKAKEELEGRCPGIVSCADIVALMARDSIVLSNGPNYGVPTGRRDGRVSNVRHADDMPDVSDTIDTLADKFSRKGLSKRDLVLLSAAHTIGTAACFFEFDRLYGDDGPDPGMNVMLVKALKSTCPKGGPNNVRFPLDWGSETTFDAHYFSNVRGGFGVLRSDAALYQSSSTKSIVDSYLAAPRGDGRTFESDFVDAIVRMGMVDVLTGHDGEIRSKCSAFN